MPLRLIPGGARRNPPKLYAPALYFGALSAPLGVRLLIAAVAEAKLAGRVFSPSQAALGRLYRRDARTIKRWVRLAVQRGYLQRTRRGRTLSNVYRLSPRLWRRLTGRYRTPTARELQGTLWRLGLRLGVDPATMRAQRVQAPPGRAI